MLLLPADERLAYLAPQPVDRGRAEIRLERFPPAVATTLAGQIGPLANLRSSPGCGIAFRSDSPWVELRLARLRHHQPTPCGIALEVADDADAWRVTSSPDLREHDGDVAVRLATGRERGAEPAAMIAWLPLISTCAIAGIAVADGAVVSPWRPPEPDWLVLGDSLAQGFCAQDPTQGWVHRLARARGRDAWNLGVGGIGIVPEAFAWALERRWDTVLIALGSNHAWRDSDVAAVGERARALAARVLAAAPRRVCWLLPPWKALEGGFGPAEFAGVPLAPAAPRLPVIRSALRAALAEHPSIELIDDLMPREPRLLPDGLHPTALGMARYAANLRSALGW
ncbi:MAG TPA: SGNH/GDSL hydrolase family protein [Planctomycetota bacterium]|nr:SGNH/GDSL hydrolase family protein [Planctomycetota bacterium]